MSIALVYAAESYHTKGALRHVVGVIQLKNKEIAEGMTMMDYWVSMIENWADANKAFDKCKDEKATKCLLSMTKYLYRTFDALNNIGDTLCNAPGLYNKLKAAFIKSTSKVCSSKYKGLFKTTKDWQKQYKGKKEEIPEKKAEDFMKALGCSPNLLTCMDKIQILIRKFNDLLVKTTRKQTTEDTIMYKRNGSKKKMPIHFTRKE